jgi:ATP-dependent Clp protease adaptor protein ClpS
MGINKTAGATRSKVAEKTAVPPLFRVLLHNDDYTSMEFVVSVLETIFRHPPTEANRIMLQVHMQGRGVCGIYPFEIAETKLHQVHARAKDEGFPLRCSMEEV